MTSAPHLPSGQGDRPLNMRQAVRALLLDDDEHVLLVRFVFPTATVWALPGGGLDPGEDDESGLRRELREELGRETNLGSIARDLAVLMNHPLGVLPYTPTTTLDTRKQSRGVGEVDAPWDEVERLEVEVCRGFCPIGLLNPSSSLTFQARNLLSSLSIRPGWPTLRQRHPVGEHERDE